MQLIVYAHPDPKSFNHAILDRVKTTLTKKDIPFKVVDLYQLNYNPVLSLGELKGEVSDETRGFQKMIGEASGLIFIFPVWWFRAPAILEGFCDKVFTVGFAYHFKKVFGNFGVPVAHLKDKSVKAFITHGAPAFAVKTIYVNAVKYRFLLGFLSFCFRITKCKIHQFWAVPFTTDKKRKRYLEKVERLL